MKKSFLERFFPEYVRDGPVVDAVEIEATILKAEYQMRRAPRIVNADFTEYEKGMRELLKRNPDKALSQAFEAYLSDRAKP